MPRLPHESLPPCTTCRKIKEAVLSTSKNVKKHILTYSLFYILVMEISSVFLSNKENYLYFWYPLLNTIGYFGLFLSLLLSSKRLRFCLRKNVVLGCLTAYYLFAVICILFQFSDLLYTSIVNYCLLGVAGSTLILTLYTIKK
jgi:hypothetical protein